MVLKYWIPVRDMAESYFNYNDNVNSEEKHIVNMNQMNIEPLNVHAFHQEVSTISSLSKFDESSTVENTFNTSLICNNANILLLDSIIRWKNGTKYQRQRQRGIGNDSDVQYAQSLAYRTYIHVDN